MLAKPGEDSDEKLAERCRDGDLEAFGLLYERYRRPILAYLYQIVRDYDQAACIGQDVFLKVFQRADRYDSSRRFSTWFYTVARNTALDWLQARNRRTQVSFADADEDSPGASSPPVFSIASVDASAVDSGVDVASGVADAVVYGASSLPKSSMPEVPIAMSPSPFGAGKHASGVRAHSVSRTNEGELAKPSTWWASTALPGACSPVMGRVRPQTPTDATNRPRRCAWASSSGPSTSARNSSTCSGARPT